MLESVRTLSAPWLCAVLAAGVTAAAAPAFAQSEVTQPEAIPSETTVGELTVTGRYGVGPNVTRLSAPVSYRDLDLTTADGRKMLRQRVEATANDLCRRLGESGMGGTALMPSCERDAMNSAAEQERVAIAQATPRPYAAATPPPQPAEMATPAAESYGQTASVTAPTTLTNGPVPDTPENRAAFGGPMSHAGRRTAASGN